MFGLPPDLDILSPAEHAAALQSGFDLFGSLLTARELARFVSERGVAFTEEEICELWRAGWLRADAVRTTNRALNWNLIREGFGFGGHTQRIYADERSLQPKERGWLSEMRRPRRTPRRLEPLFHRYRIFVLAELARILQPPASRFLGLFNASAVPRAMDFYLERLSAFTAGTEFIQHLAQLNGIAALAAQCLAIQVGAIRRTWMINAYLTDDAFQAALASLRERVHRSLRNLTERVAGEVRQALVTSGQDLDRNRDLQTIIRISRRQMEVEGAIGGASVLREMAEAVRRGAERVFDTQWREEDEVGYGMTPRALKSQLYGAPRVLDGDPRLEAAVVRQLGLDRRPAVRWYVEGDTEADAVRHCLSGYQSQIAVLNRRGQLNQRLFVDELARDVESRVYSFVSLDGDLRENVAVLADAAKKRLFFGCYFVSRPDFEFANFAREELVEIALGFLTQGFSIAPDVRASLRADLGSTETARGMERALERHHFRTMKGAGWGRRLADWALEHPERTGSGERPLIRALKLAVRSTEVNYETAYREYVVGLNGLLEKRVATSRD